MELNYVEHFKKQYPHLDNYDIEIKEEIAKETLIHLLFKSKNKVSDSQKEEAYKEYKYWILKCMQEIFERTGMTSAIAYQENGIRISWSRENLSKALIDEIVPIVVGI